MFQLKGIYAPIPIPFKESGEIDHDAIRKNIEGFWNKTGLSGIVTMGSNGEFVYLTEQEKRDVIRTACTYTQQRKHVIAGCGCESTQATIDLCNDAGKIGAEAALVLNPNYYKKSMNDQVLERFFTDVADNSRIPVILYNMPGNSAINLSSALVARLAIHPNIIGIKDSGGNIVQIMEIIRDAPEGFAVFAGSASFLLPTILAGGTGGTLALANVMPEECVKLYQMAEKGLYKQAVDLQMALLEPNAAVTAQYGIPGLKAAMEAVGAEGGSPRKPLLPLNEEKKAEIAQIIQRAKEAAEKILF